ncbi:MAG: GTP cyclohydrolase I FolE [Muribaculaceae bacterium]|nr:GTP cyclohydrolase I FolE [Muribaculaceae bacterium]
MTAEEKIEKLASHYKAILELIGEDPEREGLVKTPERAARALLYVTSGYNRSSAEVVNGAVFTSPGSGLITVKDIEFYSLCEHHILPFFGHITIGYVPNGKIIGLSKLARLVDMYARRLQVQERLAQEVCMELYRTLGCKGVIVRCEAHHLCMQMRGVEKQDTTTVTMASEGIMTSDTALRNEFFEAIR